MVDVARNPEAVPLLGQHDVVYGPPDDVEDGAGDAEEGQEAAEQDVVDGNQDRLEAEAGDAEVGQVAAEQDVVDGFCRLSTVAVRRSCCFLRTHVFRSRRPDSVTQWDAAHVADWLGEIGLTHKKHPFIDRNVDGPGLLALDIQSLKVAPYILVTLDAHRLLRELIRIVPVAEWKFHHVGTWVNKIYIRNRQPFNNVNGRGLLALGIKNLTDPPYNLTTRQAERLLRDLLRIIPVAEWRIHHVDFWLDEIGLDGKRQQFLDNHVDGPILLQLDKEDLTDTTGDNPLRLTKVEAKKLLHHLDPCPEEKRKVIREMIIHENDLYNNRGSHYAVLQGFLWTAAGILMKSSKWLALIIAAAGILLSLAAWFSMGSGFKAIRRLMGKVYPGGREPEYDVGLPVIGFDSPDEKTCDRALTRSKVVPAVFFVCWIAFVFVAAVLGKKEEDPMKNAFVGNESVPVLIALVGNETNASSLEIYLVGKDTP